ncbi:MAG: ParB-like nuclease domain-containing protein [Sedimentisphaerales bacterium]|nr:ParB-like nuclease domain-containing protein [Sedimentisphaerales bacterium]
MNHKTQSIAICKLLANPANPNEMSEEKFRKLVRNIERTGLYEPLIVRPHPQKKDHFQIINGHHRVKALAKLGKKEADCLVWNVNDEQTAVLLATLNRLGGSDVPAKKIDLLKSLKERFSSAELAKILPQTRKQIDQLINLKRNLPPIKPDTRPFAIPLVFFVTPEQSKTIEEALSKIPIPPGLTKAQHRAAALTTIAEYFIKPSEKNFRFSKFL